MKTFKYLVAAALTFLAVGCNKEQVTEAPDGQMVDVTFTAALPGEMATKAFGDGQTAKTLYVSVYENDADKTHLGDLDKTATFTDLKTQVTFSLVKGKTYNFVFWAQAEDAPYDVTDLKSIKVQDYTSGANDEKRDAFYAIRKELKVNGALTETIKLYRPFAQVNFATADYADAQKAGFSPAVSSFTASGAATTFDTFAAEGKDEVAVALTEANVPADVLKTLDGKTYTRLAMNYLIPFGKQGETHNIDVAATIKANNGEAVKVSAPNAPVQNNYRTNILGNLLTSQVIFNVEIVPAFEDPDNDIDLVNIKNAESLKALFATGGEAKLAADLVIDEAIAVMPGKEVTLDLNGKTISNANDLWDESINSWSLLSVRGGSLTIKGAGTLQAKENDCYAIDVMDGGKVIVEGGTYVGNAHTVYVYEGTAEIRGGKYSIQQTSGLPSPYGYVLNCYDANRKNGTAKIIVSGGEFEKFNPADCAAEGPHTNFVADGYISVEAEAGVWTVVRGTKPVVMTTAELRATLTAFTSAGSGDNVIEIGKDIVLKDGETWIPAKVDGYHGAGVVTVLGNGHKISGLNAPLFAGGFAGNSGIIIKDLTLDGVKINDATSDQGIGAFVCNVDSMPTIELDNCHLTNSEIISTGGARIGGLIGWTSGYNKPNDGPVDTYITIKRCSVESCKLEAKGSVGGIIGHAGCNPATFHTISDCAVKNCVLTSTDEGGWRVGVVVGTANVGELTINSITESGNTISQTGKTAPEHSNLYGRFVPGNDGKLVIDGVAQSAS